MQENGADQEYQIEKTRVSHVMMKNEQVPKKAMKGYTERKRPAERPSRR